LNGVSLKIAPGERVAVVGRVGSGKTTLAKLLLGLYSPTDGAILVGGSDVRQLDPADLRRNIGAVMQDIWLMTGTVRQNIALGAHHPSDERVVEVAQIAGVHDFISVHPDGYNLKLGERGEGLSGGQRQAITIARALVGQPPILLLDEPTSAMDINAERQLIERLKNAIGRSTLVVITHKATLLELVDRVIVMEQGKVIADGQRLPQRSHPMFAPRYQRARSVFRQRPLARLKSSYRRSPVANRCSKRSPCNLQAIPSQPPCKNTTCGEAQAGCCTRCSDRLSHFLSGHPRFIWILSRERRGA
jgi:ABC-type bacteriocin/lantibiotic exporter with double-glycine peptidase domain